MMLKHIIIKIGLMTAGGALYPACLTAQKQNVGFDFRYIKHSNAWLTSENAAGLDNLKTDKASFAEAYFNKNNGRFINYHQPDNSYSYGALTESFVRLNDRIVFYGMVNYDKFTGKHMGGSTFIDPYYNPFNIVEYADSTAGTKEMETYHLTGAISAYVWKDLLIGLKIDYKTTSYFKTKDLRHTNDLMDMGVTAGFKYKFGSVADAGINYYYRRTTESIGFKSYGNTDQQFNSLIDFGAFLGRQERFGDSGYTDKDDTKPFFNKFNGASVQIELFPDRHTRFFNELGLRHRTGYYGKRSTTSVIYTEHQAHIYRYKGVMSHESAQSLHLIGLELEHESLQNFENAYRKETSSTGNASIIYYGQNKMLDKTTSFASLTYTGNLRVEDNNPTWVLNAGASLRSKELTSIVYPSFRKQLVNQLLGQASVTRNLKRQNHQLGFTGGCGYAVGNGTDKEDGEYGTSDSKSSAVSLNHYLYREFEYLTAAQLSGNIGFRYTRLWMPNLIKIYGEINYQHTRAFSVKYIGDTFGCLAIKLGCTF
ncbi:MAG: hypothetical protein QM786_12160 [Breznakibacter sp.]